MSLRQFNRGNQRVYLPAQIYTIARYGNGPLCFSLFLIPTGGIMIGTSDGGVIKTVGSVLLGIGLTFLLIAVTLYIVVAYFTKKKEDELKQQEQAEQPPSANVPEQPFPLLAYPGQQAQGLTPTAPVDPQTFGQVYSHGDKFAPQTQSSG